MERRELLKMIAAVTGGALIGGEVFLTGCNNPDKVAGEGAFTDQKIALLDEVAETILPKTSSSAGAKEAQVGEFMKRMVNDCYSKEEQDAFHAGVAKLEEVCDEKTGSDFMKLTPEQRTSFLKEVDADRVAYNKNRKPEDAQHYFQAIKQLTITGYFTSKEGRTTALRYVPVPGKFENIDYKKGDKLFAGLN